ncbi:MAG: glucoamylase family protein, partial [Desulfitobacteriaceae bacterium]|nr:glucoamylase family protein [Desulfitobacteriaceae bacterium]
VFQSNNDLKNKELINALQSIGKNSLSQLEQSYTDLLEEINQLEKENSYLSALKTEVLRAEKEVEALKKRVHDLVTIIDDLVCATGFVPLYDEQKRLFSIGYNVEEEKLTNSYYDLLASEARITSFLAVARGEVPMEHWFRLGKSLTLVDGYKGLVSWSGTMFEYFMPCLIMKDYPNTLLNETYHFALMAQKKYGKKRGVPWGTSESGFFSFDVNLNYQYKAFGVPDLGLKRGLVDDMVVSPYSTVLALPIDPVGVVENMKRLKEEGIEGDYGFYEAVDFTTERLFMGKRRGIVQSFMAHHQGMSLIALNNYLNNQVMQERFHKDPLVKAGELLLQEKVPVRVIITKENKEDVRPFEIPVREEEATVSRKLTGVSPGLPACHLLSNGRYSLLITEGGAGYSTKDGIQVTRWRENHPVGKYGLFVFLQNAHSNETWSATYEPLKKVPDEYRVIFLPDKAEFIRTDDRVGTHMIVTVSPEDSVEIRKISITNHGDEPVVFDVTSYGETVLTSPEADAAHPMFSNLFVKTELLSKYDAILSYRRPRGENDQVSWAVHGVVVDGEAVGGLQIETDRSKFVGRGRDITQPLALEFGHPLSNTTGAVLDPIISLRRRVKINPGKVAIVSFFTGVADTKEKALEWAEKYHEKAGLERAFELSWTRSQVEEGYLNLKADEIKAGQEMIPHIAFVSPMRKKYREFFLKNKKGQQGLWAYGVSGDLPVVLVLVKQAEDMNIVHSMLKIHEYLRFKGLQVDLVILNKEEAGYFQSMHELIREAISASHARDIQDRPGGVFLQNVNTMSPEDVTLFMTVARIILKGENGPILSQLKTDHLDEPLPGEKVFPLAPVVYDSKDVPPELVFFNGCGGFTLDGREYVIRLKDGIETPAPWINVIANPDFGFIISESGSGYVWAENSRENKITPWFNDPVTNPPGEIVYLRDDETGEFWSPTPLPIREEASYTIRHGLGYSSFQHHSHGVD